MVHPCLALFAETCRQNQTGRASWDKYFQWPRQIFVVVRLLLLCWSSFHVLPMKLQKFYLHADVCACTAGGKKHSLYLFVLRIHPRSGGHRQPHCTAPRNPTAVGWGEKKGHIYCPLLFAVAGLHTAPGTDGCTACSTALRTAAAPAGLSARGAPPACTVSTARLLLELRPAAKCY